MANDQVYVIARRILDQAAAKLTTAGQVVPDRRYVALGETAHDCDQLTVTFVRIFPGFVGVEGLGLENREQCARPRAAEYLLELVRCYPALREDASPPTPAAIEAVSIDLHTDAYVLTIGLAEAAGDGAIAAGGCDDVAVTTTGVAGPSGGMTAITVTVQVQLA